MRVVNNKEKGECVFVSEDQEHFENERKESDVRFVERKRNNGMAAGV